MHRAYCSGCIPEDFHSDGASWLHVILTLLLIELALFFCRCVLVLLVLGNKIVHVAFGLCEFFSSIPSPVYQWRKAFLRNMAVKYSATRLNISCMAVLFPANATAILRPFGGMSQTDALMLFGIHSTKYDEFLFCTFNICSPC